MTLPGHMLDFIATRDHRLMRRVHRWRPPRWFRLWMIYATRGGDGWLWYGLSGLVVVYGGSTRYETLAAAWTACGAGAILFLILKKLTGRKRPNALVPHCWATLLPPDQFSFPSGHTITAFAFTVAVGSFYPHLIGALLFCALSVATSRIVLGMHFLSDVAVGAMVGAGLGYAGFMIFA
ncbi:MAG: phosphatase PAP2 family protein [Terriglobia bacterium]